jgi:DNA-binding transcriptional MerR regulator
MQRAGNRRYYRPADVELARRINRLLGQEGYTVRGVQKLLRDRAEAEPSPAPQLPVAALSQPDDDNGRNQHGVDVFRLIALRDRLVAALDS